MTSSFGDGIPIPDVIDPPESMAMTLCIPKNRDHMAAFFGALYQLTVWNSWQQDGTQHGKELAAVWWRYYLSWDRNMSDIDCESGNMDCCVEPAIIRRVNPDTGNVEQSTDGGSTWSPASGGLPSIIVEPVPPVTSGVAGNKCDAAWNVAGQVDVWINQVSVDFTTAETLTAFASGVFDAILAAVFVLLTGGALLPVEALVIPVLGAALAAAWAAGKAAFDAYWTADVKKTIRCAAYCNIGSDGSFTDAQFSAFWNQCNTELSPNAAKILFMGFLSSSGRQGLNAMAASGLTTDGDCSDCPCATCDTANWDAAIWIDGVYSTGQGTVIERTDTSITIALVDRGDGQRVCCLTSITGLMCCNIQMEWVDGTPPSVIGSANYCPDHANYNTRVGIDPAHGTIYTLIYLQASPGTWKVKFTFI